MRTVRPLAALVCLMGLALGAYGVLFEPGRLVVHETAKRPASHPPLRIAFLAGLHVSAGIGTSIVPIRIKMPPEIAIVTVRGNSSKQTQHR